MRKLPPTLGTLIVAEVFFFYASVRDLKLRPRGRSEWNETQTEPALRLHFRQSKEIVISDVFHF